MSVRAVVFDLGGVLARGDRSFFSEVEGEFDLSRDEIMLVFRGPKAAENTLAGRPFGFPEIEATIAAALPDRLGTRTSEAAASPLRAYTDPEAMIIIPEMVEILRELQQAGVPVGCLSNGPRGVLEASWIPLLGDLLPSTIMLSGETGVGKPEQAAFQTIANALGFQVSECLFIDDTAHHVDGARAAGMKAILFEGDSGVVRAELQAAGLVA